ncbi:MAG: phosphoribosylaminoimidazolesuccinocarboxamide synthase, partial [Euryarchaeota archaeon]|nr:phosphoribosylaminoimidazolesuccinocarboxamide synthase [Euryarchaeota archaeon]
MKSRSLDIYHQGAEHAAARGIILADTKFEFGMVENR